MTEGCEYLDLEKVVYTMETQSERPNALTSMWGSGNANAIRTRECVAMPGSREQTVISPPKLISCVNEFFAGEWYDPCPVDGQNGFLTSWGAKSYANPPFGKSLFNPERDGQAYREILARQAEMKAWREAVKAWKKAWMAAEEEGEEEGEDTGPCPERPSWKEKDLRFPEGMVAGLEDWLRSQVNQEGENVMLVPNRSQRPWLRAWKREQAFVLELDSVTFVGHSQPFPAPLVLGYKPAKGGPDRTEHFRKCFKRMSRHGKL